MSALFAKIPTM